MATRSVEGDYRTPDGTPAAGTVTFTPTTRIVDTRNRRIILETPPLTALLTNGRLNVTLLCTDSPELQPTPPAQTWAWHVRENIDGQCVEYTIDLPDDHQPLNITDRTRP